MRRHQKIHTRSQKLIPNYERGQTVYVTDASRAVGVASRLLSDETSEDYRKEIRSDYETMAEKHARGRSEDKRCPIKLARENAFKGDEITPVKPSFLGTKVFEDYNLAQLRDYIDWTPFFQSWDLHGRLSRPYCRIMLSVKRLRAFFKDANDMLDKMVGEKWVTAKAVVGFWPAARDGDDIIVYEDDTRNAELARLHTLRQQMLRTNNRPNFALADYIQPIGGKPDYIGGFAVTSGHGEDQVAKKV